MAEPISVGLLERQGLVLSQKYTVPEMVCALARVVGETVPVRVSRSLYFTDDAPRVRAVVVLAGTTVNEFGVEAIAGELIEAVSETEPGFAPATSSEATPLEATTTPPASWNVTVPVSETPWAKVTFPLKLAVFEYES
jgi:hypothetical protein